MAKPFAGPFEQVTRIRYEGPEVEAQIDVVSVLCNVEDGSFAAPSGYPHVQSFIQAGRIGLNRRTQRPDDGRLVRRQVLDVLIDQGISPRHVGRNSPDLKGSTLQTADAPFGLSAARSVTTESASGTLPTDFVEADRAHYTESASLENRSGSADACRDEDNLRAPLDRILASGSDESTVAAPVAVSRKDS